MGGVDWRKLEPLSRQERSPLTAEFLSKSTVIADLFDHMVDLALQFYGTPGGGAFVARGSPAARSSTAATALQPGTFHRHLPLRPSPESMFSDCLESGAAPSAAGTHLPAADCWDDFRHLENLSGRIFTVGH